MKVKCRDCVHCDQLLLKCFLPKSSECHSSYNLTQENLDTPSRCDFFCSFSAFSDSNDKCLLKNNPAGLVRHMERWQSGLMHRP